MQSLRVSNAAVIVAGVMTGCEKAGSSRVPAFATREVGVLTRSAVFPSLHGGVRIYTRHHIHGCTLLSTYDNNCWCPKWIYSKAHGGKAKQQAAGTGSLAEAQELAMKILRDFDPEIRARGEIAVEAKLADISNETPSAQSIVRYLRLHPGAYNSEVREKTGVTVSDRQIGRIRKKFGLEGQKGRPPQKL